jgi:hypothetical protein
VNLMLAAALVWVTFGLLVPRFGRREQLGVYALAIAITLIYFLYPYRYMT